MNKLLPEQWIMLVGIIFFVIVTAMALDPSGVLVSDQSSADKNASATNGQLVDQSANSDPNVSADARPRAVNAPAAQAVNMQRPVNMMQPVNADPANRQQGNMQAENIQRVQWATGNTRPQAQAQPAAMAPFSAAPAMQFQGVIEQVINRDPGGWGQIHVFIRSNQGLQELSLAPEWYLSSMACAPLKGQMIQGEAMNFDPRNQAGVMHVKTMTTQQGMSCRLRNSTGFALWSDQLK